MRQRGLQQGDGIRRHAFGVRLSFSFGSWDWLRPFLSVCYQRSEVRGCSDVFVRAGFEKKSTPVLGREATARREVYRSLFRAHLDDAALTDIRKALLRGQALGNERFREQVGLALGKRLAPKRRGRKREEEVKDEAGQMVLGS